MSPVAASAIGLALYAALLLPLAWSGRAPRLVATLYGAIVIAIGFYQTGFLQRSSLASTSRMVVASAPLDGAECRKIVELMKESGFTVDRSDPAQPKLVGAGADEIPPQVRDILMECSNPQPSATPQGTLGGDVN